MHLKQEVPSHVLEVAKRLSSYLVVTGWRKERSGWCAEVVCTLCGRTSDKWTHNTKAGRGLVCKCQWNRKWTQQQTVLGERYDAMKQRCTPGTPYAKRYGDRGIKLLFSSRAEFILWATENLPAADYREWDIDRIDNDGHYEPGNLRLVTHRQNNTNRQDSQFVLYTGQLVARRHGAHLMKHDHPELPFSLRWTETLLARGHTPEEILSMPKSGQGRRPTTSQTPDPNIVSLYRES